MTKCARPDAAIAQMPGDDVRVCWDPGHGPTCGLWPRQRVGGWTSAAGVWDLTMLVASGDSYDVRQAPEPVTRNGHISGRSSF